jgi:hypothetical protein
MTACAQCQSNVADDELHDFSGRMLCDDCYMDALSPAKTCDPWATYTASRLTNQELTPAQESVLMVVRKVGQANQAQLLEGTGLTLKELEREIATLRHMELVQGALTAEREKVLKLFEGNA